MQLGLYKQGPESFLIIKNLKCAIVYRLRRTNYTFVTKVKIFSVKNNCLYNYRKYQDTRRLAVYPAGRISGIISIRYSKSLIVRNNLYFSVRIGSPSMI